MILHDLKNTTSSLLKQDILTGASDIDRKVFRYAYDPYRKYFQKFKEIDWDSITEPEDSMFSVLDKLASREVTGARARVMVLDYAFFHGDLIKLICNKNLDCGISVTTLNKTFGAGFIPKFNVQLAMDENINNIHVPIIGQIKYNGTRVVTRWDGSLVTFTTRNGHTFEFPELYEAFRSSDIAIGVYDGELCFGDSQGRNHAEISGVVNSAIQGTPIRGGRGIVYNVFDYMSIEDFDANHCRKTYMERFRELRNVTGKASIIKVAETYEFSSKEEIEAKFEEVLANRYEGLILKKWSHYYSFKRSKDWIKLKAENTATLECLNYIPGEGKYTNSIGALQCEGIIDGQSIIVDVGTGLSDADRAKDPMEYVGKNIDIKYNEIIPNKRNPNYKSLFLPVFICVRGDI